jgi:hypothetical protein
MDKRYLHHLWTHIRPIRTWYIGALCLLFVGIHILALRQNNVGMITLRDAVYTADKQNGDTEQALQNLRSYVGSHMNTSLEGSNGVYPPIQLKYTYDRLKQAEQDRVEAVNSRVYTDAQLSCEARYPQSFFGGARVPCIEEYVKQHGTTAKNIPDALYKFAFVSPSWSPDLAGWSLVAAVVTLAFTIVRFGLGRLLRSATK